jgi:parallel beta-helix repeat protein
MRSSPSSPRWRTFPKTTKARLENWIWYDAEKTGRKNPVFLLRGDIMELNAILKCVNDKLAGEQLPYESLRTHLDDVIDTINSTLSTKFPVFSEFTAAAYPQYPNYNFFPDKYIRSVVCLGAARNFYLTDEEGALSVPAYEQQFQHNLFLMLRDYSELVPEEYRDYDRGALIAPKGQADPKGQAAPVTPQPAEQHNEQCKQCNEQYKILKDDLDAHKAKIATETEYGHVRLADLPTGSSQEGKRVARFTIGTTQNGWTAEEVDYLCDGVDDQEEIIQALNDLPATGGEVVILDGTYNITASINIPKNNVSLRGNGNATILKRMYNSTYTDSGPTAKGLITLNKKSGCKIQGLQIDGNKTSYTDSTNYGIHLYESSNDNTVTGNTCNNNARGICLYASSNNTITGNTCNNNNNYGYGIYLSSSSNDNTVTGNTCNNNYYGISLDYADNNNTITGNTCNNNNNSGIYLYASYDNTVTGNTCNNNYYYGIRLYSSSNDNTVTGNTCYNNRYYGIYLDNADNNTVTGNTCNNNYYYGIHLYESSNNTITGNTCNNNNNCGICLYESSNNTITGNTCNNNARGIYLSSSSNNTVTSNTCIRGTGTPEDYTTDQDTILLFDTDNNYNLIALNNCRGKAVVIEGGTGNSAWGNKFNATDDLP